MAEENFEQALDSVLTSIVDRARTENKQEDAWKELFEASEQGLQGLLSKASDQSNHVLGNAIHVIEERFQIKASSRLCDLVKALPFAMWKIRCKIEKEQGSSCCADKARRSYYEEVLAEINKIKNS